MPSYVAAYAWVSTVRAEGFWWAVLILGLGLCIWLLLWWTGRAGIWTTVAVCAGVAVLLRRHIALECFPPSEHS